MSSTFNYAVVAAGETDDKSKSWNREISCKLRLIVFREDTMSEH